MASNIPPSLHNAYMHKKTDDLVGSSVNLVGAEGFDRRSRRADAFRRRAMPEQLIFFIGSTPSELVRKALQRSGGGRAKP